VEALRGLSLQVPRAPSADFWDATAPARRPRSGPARHGAPHQRSAVVFGLPADEQKASVDIRRRTGFVSDEKDLYDSMNVEEMIRFTARFSRAGVATSNSGISAGSSCRRTGR